jgi:very-short-patch-repair endonuclease
MKKRPLHTSRAGRFSKELRADMTLSEKRLWMELRRKELGLRFRRQVPIGCWIVDFACFDPRIVIEVDDTSHFWKDEEVRTAYIESQGFTILRFDNREIAFELDGAIDHIRQIATELRRRT